MEKDFFDTEAALEAAKFAIGSDDAVAGDNKGKGVCAEGITNGSGGFWLADLFGKALVGVDFSFGNFVVGKKDGFLEVGALFPIKNIEREFDVFSLEKSQNIFGERIDFFAG